MQVGTGVLTVDLKIVENAHPPENHTTESDLGEELAIKVKVRVKLRTGHGKRETSI